MTTDGIRRICAKLFIGGAVARSRSAAIVGSLRRACNGTRPIVGETFRMDIGYFLKLMTEKNASDMFLTTGAPVYIKIEGKLYPLGNTGLPPGMVKKIAYSLMDEGQVPEFERELELNMAIALAEAGRFRVNVFKQRGEVGMVIRAIRSKIPSIEELNLPQVLKDVIMTPRGLVLVVGSTGSGKSTSLASMIDHRNSTTTGRVPAQAQDVHRQPARGGAGYARLPQRTEERDA
jgi:Tfp pilus assembly ATPase PilU